MNRQRLGSIFAKESIKKRWKPGASREEALRIAVEALTDAADEDRATGGVDVVRGIYPTVKLCTARGIEDVPDAEIAAAWQRIMDSRRSGA